MLRKFFTVILILAIGIPPVAAQNDAKTEYTFKKRASLVRVPVTVRNVAGRRVTDLEKENFRVFENGEEREVQFLGHESRRLTLCAMCDTSDSMDSEKIATLKAGLRNIILRANPDDDFSLITFYHDETEKKHKDKPKALTGQGFVSAEEMQNAIGFVNEGRGQTPLLDGVEMCLDMVAERYQLERQEIAAIIAQKLPQEEERGKIEKVKRQYALLIISDGGENASRANETQSKRRIKESEAQVYAIGTYEPHIETRINDRPSEEVRGPELLQNLTGLGGGRVLHAERMQYVPGLVAEAMEELRNEFVLYFKPGDGNATKPVDKDSKKKKKDQKAGDKKKQDVCRDYVKFEVKIIPKPGMPPLKAYARNGYCRDSQ